MVDIIARGEPGLMLAHWTGIHWNGQELGFKVFQEVVRRLHARYDNLLWMKLSELSRYWAARELTRIDRAGTSINFHAPFACPGFTAQLSAMPGVVPRLGLADQPSVALTEAKRLLDLKPGAWHRSGQTLSLCFDLPKGSSRVELA
jgi:hypothetical protein